MVICCIGTPKIVGDSIAPRIADRLISRNISAYVYGTTARPITALNFADYAEHIRQRHKGELIIAIDCALGKRENIGKVRLTRKGISPGKAVGRALENIGDIGILGQVGDIKGDALTELRKVPKKVADRLIADITDLVVTITDWVDIYNLQEK